MKSAGKIIAGVIALATCSVFAGPRLDLAERSFDFGTLTNAAVQRKIITLRNGGDSDLMISAVSVECESCTKLQLERDLIPPGESSALTVIFDPAGLNGIIERAVAIESNDGAHPRRIITFTARATSVPMTAQTNGLVASPLSLLFSAGEARQMRIVFVRQAGTNWVSLLDAVAPSTNFACEIYAERGAPNYRVYVRSRGNLTGRDAGDLVLITADAQRPELRVKMAIEDSTSKDATDRK